MVDWEYYRIDGRTAEVKVVVKSQGNVDEVYYFEYWDEAWRWYLCDSAHYRELGVSRTYLFHRRFNRAWFECEAHKNCLQNG